MVKGLRSSLVRASRGSRIELLVVMSEIFCGIGLVAGKA